jgi:hypothetical protein
MNWIKKLFSKRAKDKYDEQIAFLRAHPTMIASDWYQGTGLFKMMGPRHRLRSCLTMIKGSNYREAFTNKGEPLIEFTKKIRQDKKVPNSAQSIKLKDLPVFAKYQREYDKLANQ